MKTTFFCLLFVAIAIAATGQYGRVIYVSPDEKLEAIVTPTNIQERGFNEHRVAIRVRRGKRIAMNDHSSSDHEHGYGVIFAAWTPRLPLFRLQCCELWRAQGVAFSHSRLFA